VKRSHPDLPGRHILLIEDNMADVDLALQALAKHGVTGELLLISDGDRAVRFIQDLDARPMSCPDLVIVDLNLPKRSGLEVLESVRKSLKSRDALVAILSSSDIQQDRTDAERLGASRYIRKPLHLAEFISIGAIFKEMLETCGTA